MRIVHAKILPIEGAPIEDGYLRFENGVIQELGDMTGVEEQPGDLDAQGKYLLPGLVDLHTCLGLKEECSRVEGNDFNESSDPLSPQLRALDGFYAGDKAIAMAREAGVTAVVTMPGNMDLIGGQAMAVRLRGETTGEMLLRAPCGMKMALGEEPRAAFGAAGKPPLTRMGQVSMLRALLRRAKKALEAGAGDEKEEALFPVLRGEMPVYFHAHRSDDIEAMVRLAHEFGFRPILVHGADSGKMAAFLARENMPVAVGPLTLCNARMESIDLSPALPNALYRAGVRFAITSDHHQSPLYLLAVSAAFAVREGLPVEEALRAVTLSPAEIAGLDAQIGSLRPGKFADMTLYSGHPLSYRSRAEHVWIGGEAVL